MTVFRAVLFLGQVMMKGRVTDGMFFVGGRDTNVMSEKLILSGLLSGLSVREKGTSQAQTTKTIRRLGTMLSSSSNHALLFTPSVLICSQVLWKAGLR